MPLFQIDQKKFKAMLIRAIILPLVLMMGMAAILLWQIDNLLSAVHMVEDTDQVIALAQDIRTLISERETGMRGYLLTGNPVFLEPYQNAQLVITAKFDDFGKIVMDNPAEAMMLSQIRELSKQWESYARDEIALKSNGGDYLARVSRGEGKLLTDNMRASIVKIIEGRKELLKTQSLTAKRSTVLVIRTCIGLALLLGAILAFITNRQFINLSKRYGRLLAECQKLLVLEQTARTKAEQAEEVRSLLLERVITAQEQERESISRELHDEAGQSLTSLLVGLRTIERMRSVDEIVTYTTELREVTAQTLGNLRRLARGLHPSFLTDLGLVAALNRYTDDYGRFHGININLHTKELNSSRFPSAVELALYRITQEALTNIIKYASAKTVDIYLERQSECVSLIIKDDGCGFDVDKVLNSRAKSNHLGLYSMRERVSFLGGTFTLKSKPEVETAISICIPLSDKKAMPGNAPD